MDSEPKKAVGGSDEFAENEGRIGDDTFYGFLRADRTVRKILRFFCWASAAALTIIMFVAFFNVLGEKILHKGIPMSTELIKYLHVPAVFLCAGFVTLDRGQTNIDLLSAKFPKKVQDVVNIFSFILGAAISVFVGCRGLTQMSKHIANHVKSSTTGIGFALWPFSLIFALGFFMLAFSFVWSIVRVVVPKVDLEPAPEAGVEEGGEEA